LIREGGDALLTVKGRVEGAGITAGARAVHFVRPDVAWAGDLTEALKIAYPAQAWNLPFAPHIHGSAVAVAAAVHILGAIPNASMAETVFPAHPLMADLVKEPLAMDSSGYTTLTDRPGLGLKLDPGVLAKYRVDGQGEDSGR